MTGTPSDRLDVLGVPIDFVDEQDAIERIGALLGQPGCKQIATVNPEYVMLAGREPRLMALLERTALNVPDGMGIVWASRLLGRPLPGRVTGTDLLPRLCRLCEEKGYRIFFLGGGPGIADRAAAELMRRFPRLQVAGTSSSDPGSGANGATIAAINDSGADLLAVAYGCPKQDFWIERCAPELTTVKVAIGVGGALDFISGEVRRAPTPIRRAGFEWLFRLLREPSRWRRMLALPRFGWRVIASRSSRKGT